MDRPDSLAQASPRPKSLLCLGAPTTVLLMLALCAPLVWYAGRLLERHGPDARLAGLPPLELLATFCLLALPFAALRLLRIRWQADR